MQEPFQDIYPQVGPQELSEKENETMEDIKNKKTLSA
jgi:hypothetical protein